MQILWKREKFWHYFGPVSWRVWTDKNVWQRCQFLCVLSFMPKDALGFKVVKAFRKRAKMALDETTVWLSHHMKDDMLDSLR